MSDPTYDRDAIRQRIAAARSQLADQQRDQPEPEPEPEPLTEIGARMFGRSSGDDSLAGIAHRIFHNH